MTSTTDQELIQDCLKGATGAFKTLYERYQGYVYTICVRHGVSSHEIKDYLQVIFTQIFKSLPKYDASRAQFKTWLTRVTINQILTEKRKARIDYLNIDASDLNVIESSYSASLDWEIDRKLLFSILNKMPVKYITAFNLYIIDGYSHEQIADKLQIPASTSRVLVHRGRIWAMKKLKPLFQESIKHFDNNRKIGL